MPPAMIDDLTDLVSVFGKDYISICWCFISCWIFLMTYIFCISQMILNTQKPFQNNTYRSF